MAEGNGAIYNNFKELLLNGIFDLSNAADVLKMILVSAYTPNIDTHTIYGDVTGVEYGAGLGYSVGGETLTNQATSQNDGADRGEFDADDVLWTSLGALSPATPSHAILYDDTVGVPVKPLICYWEIGTTATNGGNYTLTFGATIINLT